MLSPTTVNQPPDPMEQVDLSHPITEDDIANFLLASPDFFVRHAEVLATVQLASPHGNRAVGLQQRQAEMLREKIKALESRIVDMVGHAHDNAQLADKVEQLCCELLHIEQADELPQRLVGELAQRFDMPQVALRLWDIDPRFAQSPFAQDVGDDARAFAASLEVPFCGVNPGLPVVHWLPAPTEAMSLALIPLRWPTGKPASLVAAQDDASRRSYAELPAAAEPIDVYDGFVSEDSTRREPTFEHGRGASNQAAPAPDAKQVVLPAKRPIGGLLVLASPNPKRFHADMGTDFLQRLADLCGAALSRLQPVGEPAAHMAD